MLTQEFGARDVVDRPRELGSVALLANPASRPTAYPPGADCWRPGAAKANRLWVHVPGGLSSTRFGDPSLELVPSGRRPSRA